MHSMQKKLLVLCGFVGVLLGESLGGPSGSSNLDEYHHRTTSLDELKEIDSYVATGLPLFDHGFFVNTAQGPILVKQKEEGSKLNKPRLNPGYYSQLPRLIPSGGGISPLGIIPTGFEGLSISHFNLGSAIPAQSPTYYTHHPRSQIYNAPPQLYPPQFPQFQGPSSYHHSEPSSFSPPQQLTQQSIPHPQQYLHPSDPGSNSRPPTQTHSRHFIQHHPRRRQDQFIDHQSQQPQLSQQQRQSPVAQGTFQINNYLNAEDEDVPTSYQNTMISHEPFSTRKFQRNPTVEEALEFEDTLPENLRNKFYKNQALASALAQESLPLAGETIVGEWDTTKIQKKRISDLLRAAGLIR